VSVLAESTIVSLDRELKWLFGNGVGMEKDKLMPLQFGEADFDLMRRAHHVFNPDSSLNLEKILPLSRDRAEIRASPPFPVAGMAGTKR
jgi:hypothetical protein